MATLAENIAFAKICTDRGIALANDGKLEEAVLAFNTALQHCPDDSNMANNLGCALAMLGKPVEAAAYFRQAIGIQPNHADYHANLGNALADSGSFTEAVTSYQRSLQLNRSSASTHHGLGNALRSLGNLNEAVAHYRTSLQLMPGFLKAHHGLGAALMEQGRVDEAIACFHHALRLKPDFVEAHHSLGMAYAERGDLELAVACYHQALRLTPQMAEIHNNLGNALLLQDKPEEATASYRQALHLKPEFPQAHKNLANALYSQGNLEEALAHYGESLRLKPDFGEAHWNRSLVRLLLGDFEQGWPEYEWRWTQPGFTQRTCAQPLWDGSSLQGRTILLYAEQGLGDTIHFIRYAPLVKERGGSVIVECQLPLLRLLRTAPGIDHLTAANLPAQSFDVQAPLLSLPGIFRTRLDSIPAAVPYLHADAGFVDQWRRELQPLQGFKVGIIWQGSQGYRRDRQRSIPLAHFAGLADIPGIQLVGLQKGPEAERLHSLGQQIAVLDLGSRLQDFMDTAAVMMNLDLVISVDTAAAHLAGALGVPVWVPLPLVPDWRWLLQRADSPWYPTMRLFRQTQRDRWDDVFDRITAELFTFSCGQKGRCGTP